MSRSEPEFLRAGLSSAAGYVTETVRLLAVRARPAPPKLRNVLATAGKGREHVRADRWHSHRVDRRLQPRPAVLLRQLPQQA